MRNWLPQWEMADLSTRLPLLIRGIYFEERDPSKTPVRERTKAAFIERVQKTFSDEQINDPEVAIAAVFRVLDRHISHGEVVQIRQSMQKTLRELWPTD